MESNDPERACSYHNWRHVSHVMDAMKELLKETEFEPELQEDLMLAAVWHDADYAIGKEGHENRSAILAAASLEKQGMFDI